MNLTSAIIAKSSRSTGKDKFIKDKKEILEKNIDYLFVKLKSFKKLVHNLNNECNTFKDLIEICINNGEVENVRIESMLNDINSDYNILLINAIDFEERKKEVENDFGLLTNEFNLIELNLLRNREAFTKLEEKNIMLYRDLQNIDYIISSESIALKDRRNLEIINEKLRRICFENDAALESIKRSMNRADKIKGFMEKLNSCGEKLEEKYKTFKNKKEALSSLVERSNRLIEILKKLKQLEKERKEKDLEIKLIESRKRFELESGKKEIK